MNTQQETIRCYEASRAGIQACDVSHEDFWRTEYLYRDIYSARLAFECHIRSVKPRVAPRMAIGVVVA